MIGKELLAKAKPGLRIVNVSRGGVIDEEALAEAIREGRIGGAAIDVFAEEPTTSSPLFELPQVVVTPHLGASTAEAQDKAGDTIAEQVGAGAGGRVRPLRRERERGRGVVDRAAVPAARRAPRPALRRPGRGRARRPRDRLRGPARRLRHAHPHPVGAQGRVRQGERGAGQLRERAAAGRGARHRGARVVELHVARLRQPRHASVAATTPSAARSWGCGARPAS